jgi:hypothetical protein
VRHAVQPSILNLERDEHSAWLKRAANFRKSPILVLSASQVMKHENRDRRRKSPIREGQCRRVALNHGRIRAIHTLAQLCRKCMVELETRHTTSEAP